MSIASRIVRTALAVATVLLALGHVVEAVPICSVDGRCYETNTNLGLADNTWAGAQAAAGTTVFNGQPGHLATLTSAAENAFVTANFGAFIDLGPWFGLFQLASGLETGTPAQGAAGGWQWVTGEPFYSGATNTAADVIFANWNSGEPNNSGTGGFEEDFGEFFANCCGRTAPGTWNDALGSAVLPFLVEYEPVPEPSTLLLLGSGLAALVGFGKKKLGSL